MGLELNRKMGDAVPARVLSGLARRSVYSDQAPLPAIAVVLLREPLDQFRPVNKFRR